MSHTNVLLLLLAAFLSGWQVRLAITKWKRKKGIAETWEILDD